MPLDGPVYEGTAVSVTCTFTTPDSELPTDPTSVTLKFWVNTGVETTWTYLGTGAIVRLSEGVYSALLDTTGMPGFWTVEWEGTLACAASNLARFQVLPLPR